MRRLGREQAAHLVECFATSFDGTILSHQRVQSGWPVSIGSEKLYVIQDRFQGRRLDQDDSEIRWGIAGKLKVELAERYHPVGDLDRRKDAGRDAERVHHVLVYHSGYLGGG
jgi:hypothetical protein